MGLITYLLQRCFLAIFMVAGVFFSQVSFASKDLVVERSYLIDEYGVMGIQDVQKESFKKYDELLNRGYTDSVTWVRVLVRKPDASEPIILRIRPYFLDQVDLYSQDDIVPNLKKTTGDAIKFQDLPYVGKSHGFRIHPKNHPSVYYLRIQTSSSSLLAVDALTQESLAKIEEIENLILGIYLGVMIWVLVWAIASFRRARDPIFGGFVAYQLVLVLMALSNTGYLGRFVFQDFISRDHATSNLVLLASITGFIFHKNFLSEFNLHRYIRWFLYAIFIFTIFNLFLGNFYKFSIALELNVYLILVSVVLFIFIVINLYTKSQTKNALIVLVYTFMNLVVVFTLLPLLGVIKSTELALHSALTHGLLSGLLVFTLVHDRTKKILAQQRITETENLLTRQKLQGEQKIRETQDAFIGMLSHELKSPLGVIRLGLNNLKRKLDDSLRTEISSNFERLNLAIDDMDSVIERCVEANRVEHGQVAINKNRVCISALIKDLIDFKDLQRSRVQFLGKEDTYFETDHQFIRIIISNLLDNALKYAVKNSEIQISCSATQEGLEISCENFVDEVRTIDSKQLFNKYYRDEESKRQRGSGLGLWLSRQLAKLLGGDLVYSRAGNLVQFQLKIK